MNRIQGNRLRSLHAVQLYLSANADSLGHAISEEMRTLLDDYLVALEAAAERQDAHARLAAGVVARQQEQRRALLRDHLALIARIATLHRAEEPALVALTTVGRRLPADQLAAHARGMAHVAEQRAQLFIRAGCRPTFVQDLHAAVDALLATVHERAQHRAEVRAATVALVTGLARARQVVQVIDGFLRSALAHDPDRLAGWTLVKRVPRVPRRVQGNDVAQEDAVQAEEVVRVAAVTMVAEAMEGEETVEAVEVVTAPTHTSSFISRLLPTLFGSRRAGRAHGRVPVPLDSWPATRPTSA